MQTSGRWKTISAYQQLRNLAMRDARNYAREGIRARVIKSNKNPLEVKHHYRH